MPQKPQVIYNTSTSNTSTSKAPLPQAPLPHVPHIPAQTHNSRPSSPQEELTPLVSVIIPAYNAEKFIKRTLQSALDQTYKAVEIVVIDDGSTDATTDIVRSYASNHPQIKLYSQSNAGVAAARNLGIEKANGLFIAPLDADDIWARTNLEKQVHCLRTSDRTVGMVYSWSVDIDEADYLTGNIKASPYYGNIYPAMLYANVVGNGSACLIRRRCLEKVGGYSREFFARQAQGCEDWEIYLRIAKVYDVAVVPEPLVGYRQVSGSMSAHSKVMTKSQKLAFKTVKKQFPLVYRQVGRWASCLSYLYASEQALKAHNTAQAWQWFRKGFSHDPLITLTTYVYWRLMLQLVIRSGTDRLRRRKNTPAPAHHHRPQPNSTRPMSRRRNGLSLSAIQSALSTGLSMAFKALFPARFIRQMRMYWVTTQVSPHQSGPQTLSLRKVNQLRAKVQLQSQQRKQFIDFGR